jgi:hypothetical protein
MEALKTGDKAYFESFNGLVPCKVVRITGESGMASVSHRVTIQLTASKSAYNRGETIESNGLHVIPRKAIHYRAGIARIQVYRVEVSKVGA